MKKNKIAIFATVALLAVGTAFGASKLHKKDSVTVYYLTGSPAVCTAIQCSLLTGGTPCVTSSTVFYQTSSCTGTSIGTGLRQPF
jgi:hypothetical protein